MKCNLHTTSLRRILFNNPVKRNLFCCVPGISSLTQKGILESIFNLGILKSISVRIARPINYHQTYHMHFSIGLEWYDLPKEINGITTAKSPF